MEKEADFLSGFLRNFNVEPMGGVVERFCGGGRESRGDSGLAVAVDVVGIPSAEEKR